MIKLAAVILLIGLIDVPPMLKMQRKKELALFSVLAAVTFLFGWYYIKNPTQTSIADLLLSLFNMNGTGGAGK